LFAKRENRRITNDGGAKKQDLKWIHVVRCARKSMFKTEVTRRVATPTPTTAFVVRRISENTGFYNSGQSARRDGKLKIQ